MLCFTRARFLLLCLTAAGWLSAASAVEWSSLRQDLERGEALEAESWAEVMRLLGSEEHREDVKSVLAEMPVLSRSAFTGMLVHPELAVRLGALDWLETATQEDHGFDPWRSPGDPANTAALQAWATWSNDDGEIAPKSPTLTDEDARAAIRQLLSGRREQEERAMRLLEPYGRAAISRLEDFRNEQVDLPPGARQRLRQAQYYLVLLDLMGGEAAELSSRLAFGNRDQKLAALTRFKQVGDGSLPILADFVESPDTLIRETALEVLLSVGEGDALKMVESSLLKETDTNVLHAAIRQMADISNETSRKLLASWVQHPDEDIVIEALAALGRLSAAKPEHVLPALGDPRWRVRVAGLGCISADGNNDAYRKKLVEMLADPDEFVKAGAVDAVVIAYGKRRRNRYSRAAVEEVSDEARAAVQKELRTLFDQDESFTAPVIKAWLSWEEPVPNGMVTALVSRSPDAVLPLLEALSSRSGNTIKVVVALSEHPSADVQTGAIRLLAAAAGNSSTNAPDVIPRIMDAIKNGSEPIRQAVLQSLRLSLRDLQAVGTETLQAVEPGKRGPTSLDPLYDGFLQALAAETAGEPEEEAETDDLYRLKSRLAGLAGAIQAAASAATDPSEKFQCQRLLLALGKAEPLREFEQGLGALSVSERIAILETLYDSLHKRHLNLVGRLLRDAVPEVREEALALCLEAKAPATLQLLFDEVSRSGSLIQPHEVYGYQLSQAMREQASREVLVDWSRKVLMEGEERDSPTEVLAILLAALHFSVPDEVMVERLKSPNQWVRRAAVYTLATQRSDVFHEQFEMLAGDVSAKVRAASAHALVEVSSNWRHPFDDVHDAYAASSYARGMGGSRLPETVLDRLSSLVSDSSPEVRFEAMLAFLTLSKPVDLGALAATARELPDELNATSRIAKFLRDNARRIGPQFQPLLSLLKKDDLNAKSRLEIEKRVRGNKARILTFAELVSSTPSAPVAAGPAQLTPVDESGVVAVPDQPFEVLYFYSPGCPDCARVKKHLENLEEVYSGMVLIEKNIRLPENTVLNRALCLRLGVPSQLQSVTPSVFTETNFAIREDAKVFEALMPIIREAAEYPATAGWASLSAEETASATEAVEEHFRSLTFGVVFAAGLLDGINPCAFATIIFFLSYLQVARRSPREILMVGGAFVLSVFTTYLLIGLALNEVIGRLAEFQWARTALNLTFALFAFLVMFFSFRDAFRARKGNLGDMTLQLPSFLKDRIRNVIRTGARSSHFVIAAFVSGVVISLLELACTGQVYAPIIYAIQQGSKSAIAYLVSYNIAFILPLVVIFVLAYGGLRSDALIRFQKKHTAGVKFAMGVLFLVLFLFLLGSAFV